MNTLPRAVTAQFLTDPQVYYNLRRHWSELMVSPRKHELCAEHHLLYLILLGRDWRRGFTCPGNRRKLDNGAFQGWILFRSLNALHSPSCETELLAPFDSIVTPAMLQHIRRLVPIQYPFSYQPEQFNPGYPFEAYSVPSVTEAHGTKGETNA